LIAFVVVKYLSFSYLNALQVVFSGMV